MPTIAQLIAQNAQRQNSLSDHPSDVERFDGPSSNMPEGPMVSPMVTGLPVRGTYPPNLTLHTDFQNNTQGFRIGPNMRSAMFPSPATNSVTNIKVTTIESTSGGGGGNTPVPPSPPPASSLLLETNSMPNASQSVLNLIQGTNISIMSDNSGNTTISNLFTDPVTVPNGGTGLATLTAHDVLVGEGTSNVGLISPSTAGYVLMSNGVSLDPSFQAIPGGSGGASVQQYVTQDLSGDVSISGSVLTTVDFVIINFPSSGGPWRVFFSYSYYWHTTNTPSVNMYVTDSLVPTLFGGTQRGGESSGGNNGNEWSGFSPITYANSATATFSVKCKSDASITVKQLPAVAGVDSHLEYALFSSN